MDLINISDTIIKIETAALEEWNKGNPSGYLDILASDITYFDPFTKKRLDGFDKMKDLYEGLRGKICADGYEMIDPVVQAIGAAVAVLTYNLNSSAKGVTYKWNCTVVYRLEKEDQWRIIHNHWSFVEPT